MNLPKRKLSRYLKIATGVCIISAIFIIILILSLPQRSTSKTYTQAQSLKNLDDILDVDSNTSIDRSLVSVTSDSKALVFTINGQTGPYLKVDFPHKLEQVEDNPTKSCGSGNFKPDPLQGPYAGVTGNVPQMCLYFEGKLHAAIYDSIVSGMQCHHVYWFTADAKASIENSISLVDQNWYGGGGLSEQRWPIQRVNVPLQPYLTQKFTEGSGSVKFDSFIEPYFVSADGTALMLDSFLPLFVSMNSNRDKKLVFKSVFKEPYSATSFKDGLSLSYKVCKSYIARAVHKKLSPLRLSPGSPGAPAAALLQYPIWSSRAFQEENLKEQGLIDFFRNIDHWKLPYSYLFIQGNYTKGQGNFFFNENKFPHSHQLIMEWKETKNLKTPALFVGSEVFPHVPKSGVPDSVVPFNVQYNSSVKLNIPPRPDSPQYLDISNEKAVQWFKSQLRLLKGIGVEGFLFAGGHAQSLFPPGVQLSDLITSKTLRHPNQYTEMYGEVVGSIAAPSSERGSCILGSGYLAQKHGFIADAGPFRSTWDHQKGLKAVIPTTITYGLLGYPFVLTGPVGGLYVRGPAVAQSPPPTELYIRWLSLAAYLPALELAWGPWMFGQEVINHARSMLEMRKFMLWPEYLSEAVEEAAKSGTPIVRPLWWIAPNDKTAQFIDCEFMLGSKLLVAPVLMNNARSRSVYLPEGSHWKDNLKNKVHKGGQWMTQYSVGLYDIATFERLLGTE
ncbi:hypothetical protein ElyMa_002358200 [Elysia marginata]|uniref:Glycoside hydrolase family 31 N-terminal domain-containing protein n=1 Tax=Elysia marginata TaxID=1093978 RepID=A0AAV4GBS7_9GAST|nr:hypothetical protein ElyMa_002358200 [Elysia marginata]